LKAANPLLLIEEIKERDFKAQNFQRPELEKKRF
jgi:hypothetical protein